MTQSQITNKQEVDFTLQAQTDAGIDIDVSPVPVYSLESGPVVPATLAPNVTGFAGTVTSGESAGDSVFSCSYFVKGVPQTAEITITVTEDGRVGAAVFIFGVPRDKEVTPPTAAK